MLGPRIKKLILIRLLFGSLLLYAPRVFPDASPVSFYGVSVLVCLLSIFYLTWYLTRRRYRWLALGQIFMDVLLESYLILVTGGMESVFAAFYVLTLLSSALVLGDKKTVFVTTGFCCAAYFGSAVAEFRWGGNHFGSRDPVYLFYGVMVKIAILLAAGTLSRYLSGTVLELQNRLKLSERLSFLGEVVSKISHEIKNPLSSIRTAAEVLRDSLRGKLTPSEEKMIAIVDNESDRLTKTLERILSYAKQVQPDPKMLRLDELIERTLSLVKLHPPLYSNGIVVEKHYDPATHLYADEEQVLSALLNLTLNAYQAMPQGGIFRISAREELRGTKIDLEDSGGGISPEKLRDLFLPFKSTKKGGTGLGLAEVHKIVTLHEGGIEVESHAGKGALFHLFFPKP